MIKVKLFAVLKEQLGEEIDLEVPEPATARSLLDSFLAAHPQFAGARNSLNVAVDHSYSREDQPISAGQEVAIFPPVSGGSGSPHEVTEAPINLDTLVSRVASPRAGAISTFLGVVRDNSLGRKVRHLFYEAYPPMAIKEMERLEAEVREKYDILSIAVSHRVGRLEIGEASVAIAVSSAHRREGIEACHFAIDRLKEIVPVWKKEYWEGGEVWLENPQGSTITRAN